MAEAAQAIESKQDQAPWDADDNDDEKDTFRDDTPEPEEYGDSFDPFDVLCISGSYLGQQTHLNAIRKLKVTNTPSTSRKHDFVDKSTIDIHEFNTFQATQYKKLNKRLTSKQSKKYSKSNTKKIGNFWDREYSSFCIAPNVSYQAIQSYAYTMTQKQNKNDEEESKTNHKDKTCDVLIQCGGCYAVNPSRTSTFCDGYIVNSDHELDINAFKLPSLEIARSNCASIYHHQLGVICVGGRSNKKDILNVVEVLNINENDFEWNTDVIPAQDSSRSRHPSIGLYDDLLFVCGGRGVVALNSAECIDLKQLHGDEGKWTKIGSMNYARSFASNILEWKSHNAMIVMGGYGSHLSEFYAEQYDLNANKWCAFPKSNFSHKYNPCVKLIHDLLFVFCDKRTKSNLGIIEILDTRTAKWMKCKLSMHELLQFDAKQELRRLICI